MKASPPYSGTMTAELAGVLMAYPDEYFAPGELVPTLWNCPAWSEYLSGFEADRGRPAAVGRFLNELGLSKAAHHRSRGSLYSARATLQRLQSAMMGGDPVAVAEVRSGEAGEGKEPVVLMADDNQRPEGGNSDSLTERPAAEHQRRRSDDRREQRVEPAVVPGGGGVSSGMPIGGGAGAAVAAARSAPVIGWRRRATDLARSPRPQAGLAGGGAVPIPPALPSMGGSTASGLPGGAAAPPMWVGGGSMAPMAGYPGGALAPSYAQPEIFGSTVEDEAGLPLSFYWTQIRRHLYKIILAAVVITTVVAFYTLRIPKQYSSAVTLRMDFRTPAMIQDASQNPAFDPTVLISTEIADVTQRAVILDAINNAHLDQNASLRKQLSGGSGAVPTTIDPNALDDSLVGLIASHTTAVSPTDTNNINISYQSLDPNTSAAVANALAKALITHEFNTRQQEQNDALKFMEQQFAGIQAKVEKEQAELTQYQHANNILNPNGQTSIQDSTLTTLNSEYLTAQGQLTKFQAEEDVLKKGDLNALLASDDGASLKPDYNAWRTAQAQFNEVKATRGPANPAYTAAERAMNQAHSELLTAMKSVKSQIDSMYARAQQQMALVSKQLNAAKAQAQAFDDKAINYNNLKRSLDTDQKLYDSLNSQITQQQLSSSQSSSSLRVTNPATPNPVPVYPNVKKNIGLAAIFSLFLGCALAVLVGYMDRSFTSPEGVEQYLRIPLLGALPVLNNKANPIELAEQLPDAEDATASGKAAPRSAFAESILMLRTAVLYAAPHGFRTLSITSAQPQEGKSLIISNLAIALALHGSKVLLIDADIRRPTQHRTFEITNQVGLSNLLRQSAPLEDCFRATTVERLYVMPAGPAVPNPSELVATMLAQVLNPLTTEFDYILVDAPPVLGFADAVSVATVVEGTILVARAGKTQRELVQAALQPLKRVRARVLGLVLNQVSSSLNSYYSYYGSHYSRYYGGRDEDNDEAKS